MARQVRIQYAGAVYHVMARGNRRGDIFVDDVDRTIFLKTLGETCLRTGFEVYAWVLKSNHYHLAFCTPEANLVDGMGWLQNTYTRRFNGRHRGWGRLFGDRYKAVLVEVDPASRVEGGLGYLTTLLDYIHLNPARAGLIDVEASGSIRDFPWSSLAQGYAIPPSKRPLWLDAERGFDLLGIRDSSAGRRRYVARLDTRVAAESDEGELASRSGPPGEARRVGPSLGDTLERGWFWGSDAFRDFLLEKLAGVPPSRPYRAGSQGRDHAERAGSEILAAGAEHFGIGGGADAVAALGRGDRRRVAIAWAIWKSTSLPQSWIASRTGLRSAANVSQQVRPFDRLPGAELSPLEREWRRRSA